MGNRAAVATRLPLNATWLLLSYRVISILLVAEHKGGKESYIEEKIKRTQQAENKMPSVYFADSNPLIDLSDSKLSYHRT